MFGGLGGVGIDGCQWWWIQSVGHSFFQFFQLSGQRVQSFVQELGQSVGQSLKIHGASRMSNQLEWAWWKLDVHAAPAEAGDVASPASGLDGASPELACSRDVDVVESLGLVGDSLL